MSADSSLRATKSQAQEFGGIQIGFVEDLSLLLPNLHDPYCDHRQLAKSINHVMHITNPGNAHKGLPYLVVGAPNVDFDDLLHGQFREAWELWANTHLGRQSRFNLVLRIDGLNDSEVILLRPYTIGSPLLEVRVYSKDYFDNYESTDDAWQEIIIRELPLRLDHDNWDTTRVKKPLLQRFADSDVIVTTTDLNDGSDALSVAHFLTGAATGEMDIVRFAITRQHDQAWWRD